MIEKVEIVVSERPRRDRLAFGSLSLYCVQVESFEDFISPAAPCVVVIGELTQSEFSLLFALFAYPAFRTK
jgi:hypothetical protein